MTTRVTLKIIFLNRYNEEITLSVNNPYEGLSMNRLNNFLNVAKPVLNVVSIKQAYYYYSRKTELS